MSLAVDAVLHSSASHLSDVRVGAPGDLLFCYYQIVRGLPGRTRDLYLSSTECDFDVICFTETQLHSDIGDTELFCENFTIFRSALGVSRTGGVLLALSRSYLGVRTDSSVVSTG